MKPQATFAWLSAAALTLAALLAVVGCNSKPKETPATQAAGEQKDRGYVEAVLHSREMTKEVVQSVDLSSILTAIRIYATAEGKFPPSLDVLVDRNYLPAAMVRTPDGNARPLAYIPGLSESSPPTSIVLYVTRPDSDGRQKLIRLDGQIQALPPDQLQAELKK